MGPCESLIHQPIVMTHLITLKKHSSIFNIIIIIAITNTNILLLIQHTNHQFYKSKLSTICITITTQAKETSFTQHLIITNIVINDDIIILIIITHPRNDLLEEA